MSGAERFPFVQLELAGSIGLDEARYLARGPQGERVVIVRVAAAPAPPRRWIRRPRPTEAPPEPDPPTVPITALTVVRPQDLGEGAPAWLETMRSDPEQRDAELAEALRTANRAVHAQRSATLDPYRADISPEHALAVRIGYGPGERLADGRWEEAIQLPAAARRRRSEALRPQERVAAVLGGHETVAAFEELLLRARGDLDADRSREAALQLRIGLEALLAEQARGTLTAADPSGRQAADVAALEERKRITGEAANEALRGELSAERRAEVAETLAICERVLRRARAYG